MQRWASLTDEELVRAIRLEWAAVLLVFDGWRAAPGWGAGRLERAWTTAVDSARRRVAALPEQAGLSVWVAAVEPVLVQDAADQPGDPAMVRAVGLLRWSAEALPASVNAARRKATRDGR